MTAPGREVLWTPPPERVFASNMSRYQRWLAAEKNVCTTDFDSLWCWSISDLEKFWLSIWEYFDVIAS
ncbi:MAG: acetoacetate--CoA ligase, partial [Rhodococcus sp. (in: high G+C Gram-positive bacteria)]